MNTPYTPGPWIAANSQNGRIFKQWRIYRANTVTAKSRTVAVIQESASSEEEYANAQLLQAAPELAEALMEWVTDPVSCSSTGEPSPYPDCTCWICDRNRDARRVLVKAGLLPA